MWDEEVNVGRMEGVKGQVMDPGVLSWVKEIGRTYYFLCNAIFRGRLSIFSTI
jgi:hypothetical protein